MKDGITGRLTKFEVSAEGKIYLTFDTGEGEEKTVQLYEKTIPYFHIPSLAAYEDEALPEDSEKAMKRIFEMASYPNTEDSGLHVGIYEKEKMAWITKETNLYAIAIQRNSGDHPSYLAWAPKKLLEDERMIGNGVREDLKKI